MQFGKNEERMRARRATAANEAVGSAVMEASKTRQAKVFDELLDAPELSIGRKLDLAIIADEQGILCKSEVLTELRPRIVLERRSRQEQAERARAAREKKQWLRKRGEDYDRDGPDSVQ